MTTSPYLYITTVYSYWRTSPCLNKLYNIQLQYFRANFFYKRNRQQHACIVDRQQTSRLNSNSFTVEAGHRRWVDPDNCDPTTSCQLRSVNHLASSKHQTFPQEHLTVCALNHEQSTTSIEAFTVSSSRFDSYEFERLLCVINRKGGVTSHCLLYTSPSPRD